MAKLNEVQIKQLMNRAFEAKNQGGSLSNVFKDFAKQTGRAKGSIRNVYYSSLKQMESDLNYKKEILGDNDLSVSRIISFEEYESERLLEKILLGVTFGKSVRRVISEMTDSPKLALRFQNKYRNLLRYEKQRVLNIRGKLIAEYGKCYDPYKELTDSDQTLTKLKKEINGLCDRIAIRQKEENERLRKKVLQLEEENAQLLELLSNKDKSAIKEHFQYIEKKTV